MISIELAEKFKEAGLEWNPQAGDFYCYPNGEFSGCFAIGGPLSDYNNSKYRGIQLWLPRLDQLLAEGEKLGYRISVEPEEQNKWYSEVTLWDDEGLGLAWKYSSDSFFAPEDAAAHALLWVLKQMGGLCND